MTGEVTTTEQAGEVLQPLAADIAAYRDTVDGMLIESGDDQANAGDIVKELQTARKRLEDKRKELVGPMDKAVRHINALFKTPRDELDAVVKACKGKMNVYLTEQARAAEEARREEERKAREEAEAARKAAEELDRQGATDTAAKVVEEADKAVTKAAKPVKPTVARGSHSSVAGVTSWSAEVFDFGALIQAVAEGRCPQAALLPNTDWLKELARKNEFEGDMDGVRYAKTISARVR